MHERPPEPPLAPHEEEKPTGPTKHSFGTIPDLPKSEQERFADGTKPQRPPGPDIRIDLSAPDAVDRLEKLGEEVEAQRRKHPDEIAEDHSDVTEEDERELEEFHAERDAERVEDIADDPRFWTSRRCDDAVAHLLVAAKAGYGDKDLRRMAGAEAERILAELEKGNAIRVKRGLKPLDYGADGLEAEIMERFASRTPEPGSPGDPTRKIESEDDREEDDTQA